MKTRVSLKYFVIYCSSLDENYSSFHCIIVCCKSNSSVEPLNYDTSLYYSSMVESRYKYLYKYLILVMRFNLHSLLSPGLELSACKIQAKLELITTRSCIRMF